MSRITMLPDDVTTPEVAEAAGLTVTHTTAADDLGIDRDVVTIEGDDRALQSFIDENDLHGFYSLA